MLKSIHPYVFDMFNLRYRDFLYAQIADLILESGKPVPQLEAVHDNPDCFAEIVGRLDACVVLALHTGFPHSARLLTSSGHTRVTSIVGGPESVKALYRVNHVPDFESIRTVQADRNTLVNLKASVKDGHAIVCAPDHVNPATSKCDLISRAMFDFAVRKRLQIFCLPNALTDRGKLTDMSERAAQGATAAHAIEQFCRFCLKSSGRHVTPITQTR